jgi:DHA2 family multidrug resistance protein-like MFS transporter
MLRRFGPRTMVAGGFCLTALAVAVLGLLGGRDNAPLMLTGFVLLGYGLETTLFGAYESMLSETSAASAGGAAAIGETSYQLGAGIGIALLGTVMNAAYAPGLSSVPGVPAADGTSARHSLGEAYEVADRLGGTVGAALRQAARTSFVHGLHVTLLVSAGLLVLGAVAALRLPREMGAECGRGTGGVPAPRATSEGHVARSAVGADRSR